MFTASVNGLSDSKSRLITVLLALITEHPAGEITIDVLCRESGVKKGSFYHHFASKAALAVVAFDVFWNTECRPDLDRSFNSDLSPMLRFSDHLHRIVAYFRETVRRGVKGRPMLIWSACSSPGQDAEIAAALKVLFGLRTAYYESALSEAISRGEIPPCDVRVKAIAFAGLIDGVLTASRILEDPTVPQVLEQVGMELLRAPQRNYGIHAVSH